MAHRARGNRAPEPELPLSNAEIAAQLDAVAHLLRDQDADVFRVEAFRRAAETVRELDEPVRLIFDREGDAGLERLPAIGPVIARAIRSLVLTRHLPMLDRMRGELHPTSVLASVGGVGPTLAKRLEEELGVRTLEELEMAAHDGRLQQIAGFGEKRVRTVREALGGRLGRMQPPRAPGAGEPSVHELLEVDREYREKAERGELRRIAPRRFNRTGEAWLPILHTTRHGRQYTALYSNTAQAHHLDKTADWVVLHYDGLDGERQCTVVTATRGALRGRRVVRGREAECAREYPTSDAPASTGSGQYMVATPREAPGSRTHITLSRGLLS